MPLGNGELAVSVWMDEKGVLRFYLARTDAVTELDRTVKLGMVEVRTAPGFLSDGDFIQRLELEHGIVHMKSCGKELWIWVDDASDIVYVSGRMKQEMKVKVRYYTWRTEKICHGIRLSVPQGLQKRQIWWMSWKIESVSAI